MNTLGAGEWLKAFTEVVYETTCRRNFVNILFLLSFSSLSVVSVVLGIKARTELMC